MPVVVDDLQTKIIEKLNWVHYNEEWWNENKMSEIEATKYHEKMLRDVNILCYLDGTELIGYVEFWRISFAQFGKIICKAPFSAYLQDVTSGNIAYVANVWIDKEWRGKKVYKELKLKFLSVNFKCDYFVGEALRKKTQPVKVFNRSKFFEKLKGE